MVAILVKIKFEKILESLAVLRGMLASTVALHQYIVVNTGRERQLYLISLTGLSFQIDLYAAIGAYRVCHLSRKVNAQYEGFMVDATR